MHRSLPAFRLLPLLILVFLLAACTLPIGNSTPTTAPTHGSASSTTAAQLTCPAPLNDTQSCYTPYALRVAYDVEPLTERGYTGKGQTIIDIVSYGSPTLQQDM